MNFLIHTSRTTRRNLFFLSPVPSLTAVLLGAIAFGTNHEITLIKERNESNNSEKSSDEVIKINLIHPFSLSHKN